MSQSVQELLDLFNKGDFEVIKYFGDFGNFFKVLQKRGLANDIDPINGGYSEDWQNEYLLFLYENDKEKYYYWMDKILGDVVFEGPDHKAFFVGDRDDLAELFCDGNRYDVSQKTISQILSGEGDVWEAYWDTTDNVYRDVIEELNEKNINRLKEYIIEHLSGKELSPETEEMELIASEQNHPDFWTISPDNVSRIIDDEESMNSLLSDELSDLRSDLYNIHNNAYNSAYESDVWDEIWSELNKYFEGQGVWVSKPHPYKKDTMVEKFKIPISDFEGYINDYLYNNKKYGNSGTLEYQGGFLTTLSNDVDCLSIRVPDYPDLGKVDKNINSYFEDYI